MTYFMISILFSSILIIVTWIIDVVDVLRTLLGSQFATSTLGLRNPSLP